MSNDLNRATIIGRLGADPEVRYTANGVAVATFSVATGKKWTDNTTGQERKATEWHRVVAWDRLGEICGEFLHKGKQVYVEGELRTREWDDRDGVKRYTTEIVAYRMQMLGSRDGNYPTHPAEAGEDYGEPAEAAGGPPPAEDEDDIPF